MAQNLAVCEFCDFVIEITPWKCINCDITLCENCKTRKHSKIKGSEDHSVFMLKQLGTLEVKNSVRKLELANIMCSMHKKETCTAYCKSCCKELCTFCAIEGHHLGHQILKLETVYNEQVSELTRLNSKMEDDLPFFIENLKKIEIRRQKGTDSYNKAKQKIIQREKYIKEKVTQEAEVLSRELDIMMKPENDAINKTKETLQQNIEWLKHTTNLTDHILQSNDAKSVLDTLFSVRKELPSRNIEGLNLPLKSSVDFIAPVLSLRFGALVIMPKLTILQSVQTPLKTIKCLESFDNGKYISIGSHKIRKSNTSLETFQLNGSNYVSKSSNRLEFKAFGMTVIENNRILLLCRVKILSCFKSNEVETFFQNPNELIKKEFTSMCTTAKGTILLGYSDNFSRYYGFKLINDEGELKDDIQLKYSVQKMAANEHGTYIISHSGLEKAVKGLSSSYTLQWTYIGHRSVNSNNDFKPKDIAVSASGFIYVTDTNTNSIHVLTQHGDFVANYGKDHGINDPAVLHINKEGQLMIWCKDGKIHVADISS